MNQGASLSGGGFQNSSWNTFGGSSMAPTSRLPRNANDDGVNLDL